MVRSYKAKQIAMKFEVENLFWRFKQLKVSLRKWGWISCECITFLNTPSYSKWRKYERRTLNCLSRWTVILLGSLFDCFISLYRKRNHMHSWSMHGELLVQEVIQEGRKRTTWCSPHLYAVTPHFVVTLIWWPTITGKLLTLQKHFTADCLQSTWWLLGEFNGGHCIVQVFCSIYVAQRQHYCHKVLIKIGSTVAVNYIF